MVDVVVADVTGEPVHEARQAQKAGGVESRALVGPARRIAEDHIGEIVLHVKEIGAQRRSQRVGQQQREEQRPESAKDKERGGKGCVQRDSQQAVEMLFRALDKRQQGHPQEKHGHVPAEHVQWMPHKAILQAGAETRPGVVLARHHRIGADAGT